MLNLEPDDINGIYPNYVMRFLNLENSSQATLASEDSSVQGASASATITLAGKQYDLDGLSEPARQLVSAIRASEEEMKSTRNQLALMDVGRRALVAQLRLAVENPEAFQRLQAPESTNSEQSD